MFFLVWGSHTVAEYSRRGLTNAFSLMLDELILRLRFRKPRTPLALLVTLLMCVSQAMSQCPNLPSTTMADLDGDFDAAQSGASTTFPQQCSALRKNGHVILKNHPCQIVEMTTSETGKVHLVGIDIFTGNKYEDVCSSTHNMDVPNVNRKDYQLNNIDDSYMSLMDDNGDQREDLKVPNNDLGKKIMSKFEKGETFNVTVLKACDTEMVIGIKSQTS
ncbi:eukaryotic translation initiation factor 5A-1-like isoform X2 [Branchiostoma lanceolatum]|uniref:eukaryotic translation initiation factor 5A-1-like isoform X2 n=1 Tax=Branchiostoma lanceolatum TaxID=7740 RepID=UPI0034530422